MEWNIKSMRDVERQQSDWGGWRRKGMWLEYPAYSGGTYPIDLDRFVDSAHMLDIIMQVAGKAWATDECLAGLVRALDDLLHPQATLCSCGTNKRLTRSQVRAIVKRGPT